MADVERAPRSRYWYGLGEVIEANVLNVELRDRAGVGARDLPLKLADECFRMPVLSGGKPRYHMPLHCPLLFV